MVQYVCSWEKANLNRSASIKHEYCFELCNELAHVLHYPMLETKPQASGADYILEWR